MEWWNDRQKRGYVVIGAFLVLAFLGTLMPAVNALFSGDTRVMRVEMKQGAGQPAREALRQACGSLPRVQVIADRGNPDPQVQGRFPVRFGMKDMDQAQETALAACISSQPGVRGYLVERRGS